MILQEVYNKYPNAQIVLSLTNNNDVLVTGDCFNPQSKFCRMSKIRLSVDFVLSGVFQNDSFVRTSEDKLYPGAVLVYRTYREKKENDYVLYIYTGEYSYLHNIKKKINRKRIISQTSEQRQVLEGKPLPNNVLDVCPHIDGKKYYIEYRSNGLKSGTHYSQMYQNTEASYLGYYFGTLVGLVTAKKYPNKINMVRVFVPDDEYAKGVYMFPLKKWKPKNTYMKQYTNHVEVLKHELQELGISICFMEK